jgi:hypothetical protein
VSALKRITLVVPPASDSDGGVRETYRYDKFVEQLRPHTSASVEILEDEFVTAPSDGIILLDRFGAVAYRRGSDSEEDQNELLAQLWPLDVRRRIVCLNVNRGHSTLAMLERLGLAGAIDQIDYLVAVRETPFGTSYGDSGLYCLKPIAESLGCKIDYEAEHYCKTVVPPFASLATLLSRYLDQYWSTIVWR